VLHSLSCENLLEILRNPKSSVILSKKRDFRAYGIGIDFTDDALGMLAERAFEERIGARGLVSAIEKALLSFEKKLPSVDIESFTVTADTVRSPQTDLQRLLEDNSLQSYIGQFSQTHGITLEFTTEAADLIKKQARDEETTPAELCVRLFADYGHGLRLAGQQRFEITAQIADNQ